MARDSLVRYHSGSSDSMLLDVADLDALFDAHDAQATSPRLADSTPTNPKSKRKVGELRVECPLTPEMLSDSPMKKLKSVTFSDTILVGHSLQPWPEDNSSGASDSLSATGELVKVIEPTAKEANRKVVNERLTGADTVSRVDVPVLDFTLPVAPWNEFSQCRDKERRRGITELEAQTRFLQRVKRDDLRSATSWRGVSDLDLSWGWFASPSPTIKLTEKLHGETEFVKVQAELKTGYVATSANEVWKKDGLRVLDEEEDDEEDGIEPADFEEPDDVEAMIRKRKLELQEQDELMEAQHKRRQATAKALRESSQDPRTAHHRSPGRESRPLPLPLSQHKPVEKQKNAPTELLFGGFSASTALHKFMETQGKAIMTAKADVQTHIPATPNSHITSARNTELSAGLGQSQIESLHPKVELIYRDYTLPHSAAVEADIILSPSTGVLLTSLQQIKQAPLPGQVARSPVKQRIAALQERYERLLVLVSEGLREDSGHTRPEDTRDTESLSSLEVFAAQLAGDAVIHYIRGGEQTLARSIVQNMAKYGLPHGGQDIGDIKLLAVETTWEVFLRRAGVNPFAAQVIVASLKVPTVVSLPASSCVMRKTAEAIGLPTFLLMEREDRAEHFQAIMGGRRILDRVSRLLDQRWLSASNEYRT
ncbi:uncharacterized protein M421DRAFT_64112 [Didymella exigua CBS 183.55]|uniref:Uncharacterized protein n=1 Tax=Didymella exigua CBS 183.55 TaxID=1150837 RepID=A0A6A5RKZ2_9PLEO|nr:uncharacterized protein M421DRAFT_64112 [Didymella exigua CBS 183.55]KAF1928133.1 hypothetical protein M421DRAFT_64112 [Didymella exigua CBS 183.55]